MFDTFSKTFFGGVNFQDLYKHRTT